MVREHREALKMRQDDLALATGVGRRFILELEAGKPSCQLGRALVVAAAVGLRTFDLMSANNDADNALLPDLIDDSARQLERTTGVAELPVYYESRVVGTIEVHAEGPSFAYAPQWLSMRGAFPISLLMPLSPRRVPPRLFLPWAANLLPEATQLKAIGLQLGAAPGDVIGILSELGRDTAGALSIGEPGTANTATGARSRATRRWSASSRSCRRSRSSSATTASPCRLPACRPSSASPSTTRAASACRSTAHRRRGS